MFKYYLFMLVSEDTDDDTGAEQRQMVKSSQGIFLLYCLKLWFVFISRIIRMQTFKII